MKQLILIKTSNTIDLAHLYEHIFCTHIVKLFYKNNLFQRLDYSLVGKTYQGGIIYIEIEFYTEAALSFAETISALKIQLDQTVISKGYAQLIAEEEQPFGDLGYKKVEQALNDIDSQPWETIDSLGIIDVKNIRRKSGSFYIVEGNPVSARKLTVNVTLDIKYSDTHRALSPLFRQLAWLLTVNLQNALCDTRGYFSLDNIYTANKKSLSSVFNVVGFNDVHVNIKDDLDICIQLAENLMHHKAFEKFTNGFRTISYYDEPDLAPNIEKTYEETLIFIGADGWRQIATKENCESLLDHMSIELQFGRQKVSAPLVKIN